MPSLRGRSPNNFPCIGPGAWGAEPQQAVGRKRGETAGQVLQLGFSGIFWVGQEGLYRAFFHEKQAFAMLLRRHARSFHKVGIGWRFGTITVRPGFQRFDGTCGLPSSVVDMDTRHTQATSIPSPLARQRIGEIGAGANGTGGSPAERTDVPAIEVGCAKTAKTLFCRDNEGGEYYQCCQQGAVKKSVKLALSSAGKHTKTPSFAAISGLHMPKRSTVTGTSVASHVDQPSSMTLAPS